MIRKHIIGLGLLFVLSRLAAQQVEFVDRYWIEKIKSNESDTVYVLNFWATWCKTCVEEIPNFEKLNEKYKDQNVKVILVSHDFKRQVDSHLKTFIRDKMLKCVVVLMNETNPHHWIDYVDMSWSGELPVTLVVCGAKDFRRFYDTELSLAELEEIIKPFIKK
ncbi:MAG: redoxin domain-containing protein [Bacteroidia bacterium]